MRKLKLAAIAVLMSLMFIPMGPAFTNEPIVPRNSSDAEIAQRIRVRVGTGGYRDRGYQHRRERHNRGHHYYRTSNYENRGYHFGSPRHQNYYYYSPYYRPYYYKDYDRNEDGRGSVYFYW
jgi:hypothetical protein